MKNFASLLLIALFSIGLGVAQDSTKVRFYIKGSSDFWIRLDGEVLPMKNVHRITPGEHDIEIWSPQYLTYSDILTVPAKDSISYYQELKQDPDYVSYLFEMDKYRRKVFFNRTAPLFVAFSGAVTSPFLYVLRKRWHEEAVKETFKSEYFSTSASGTESVIQRYNTINAAFFTSIGMVAGGLTIYAIRRTWLEKQKKPKYRQKNPFTLETFEIGMNRFTGAPEAGVTLNF